MTNKSKVKTITDLATSLATKELEGDDTESSADLLDALNSVAKLLEVNSGSDSNIKMLAQQVQELVKAKTPS
jgi:hypothetical protein